MCAINATVVPSMTEVYIQPVRMGAKEWGSNVMIGIANELFTLHRDTPYLVVEVWEHGGWWLQFARLNGITTVVGTANDGAVFTDNVSQFHREIRSMKTVMLPLLTR